MYLQVKQIQDYSHHYATKTTNIGFLKAYKIENNVVGNVIN